MSKFFALILTLIFSGCSGVQTETLRVPNSDLAVKIEKTHAHLFLAEYDFKLILEESGKEIDSVNMTGDSGGLTRIEVVQVKNAIVAFRDHAQTFCLDLQSRDLSACTLEEAGVELGYLDFDETRNWRFIKQ